MYMAKGVHFCDDFELRGELEAFLDAGTAIPKVNVRGAGIWIKAGMINPPSIFVFSFFANLNMS